MPPQRIGKGHYRKAKAASELMRRACDPKGRGRSGSPGQLAMPKASPTGIEKKSSAPVGSHGHSRNIESVHHTTARSHLPCSGMGSCMRRSELAPAFHLIQLRLASFSVSSAANTTVYIALLLPFFHADLRVSRRPAEFPPSSQNRALKTLASLALNQQPADHPLVCRTASSSLLLPFFGYATGLIRPLRSSPITSFLSFPLLSSRVSPSAPQRDASPHGCGPLGLFPYIRATGSWAVPRTSLHPLQRPFYGYADRRPPQSSATRTPADVSPRGFYVRRGSTNDTYFSYRRVFEGSLSFVSRMLTCTGLYPRFSSNGSPPTASVPQQLGSFWDLRY